MKNNKQFIINLITNLVSFSVTFGISFFLSPYVIANVSKEAYGFVSLSNDFINYIALLTIALNSMANRFISVKMHQGKTNEAVCYFNSVLIGNAIVSLVMIVPSIICVVNLEKILNINASIVSDVKILFALTFITFIFSIISSTFSIATFITNRLDLASYRDIQASLAKAACLILLFTLFKAHVFYIGIAGLCYTIVLLLSNLYYTKKLLPEFKIGIRYFRIAYIVEMIKAGVWNVVSKISSILSTELSLLISNITIGDSAMGILSIAKTLPNIVLQLIGIIANIFAPEFIVSYAKNEIKDLDHQIQFSMKVVGTLAGIPIVLLIGFGIPLFQLWLPTVDAKILYIMSVVYGFGLLFAGPVEPLYNVFIVTNNIKIPSLYALVTGIMNISLVFIGINAVESDFYKMLIIMGTGTVFTIIRTAVFIPLYAAHCLEFKKWAFYPQILKSLGSATIMSLIAISIQKTMKIDSWIRLIIVAVFVAMVHLIVNVLLTFTREERKSFVKKLRRGQTNDQ